VRVLHLVPGMEIPSPLPGPNPIFIARCSHPFYEGFQLVIWRLGDGTISLDALSVMQDVGIPVESTYGDRRANLKKALHGEKEGS
jgi:hypothetical protein